MEKYIEVTGKTEDEALAKGLAQLGLTRDDVSLEILNRGKTGFLGIGSVPAKVRLTYEAPDEPASEPEPAPQVTVTPQATVAPPQVKPAPKAAKPAPRPAKSRPQQSRPAKPQAPKATFTPQAQTPKPQAGAAVDAQEGADGAVVEAIVKFQAGLFERMGVQAASRVEYDGQAYQVTLEGDDLGMLIGHRGETLDAIQQLTGYAVNRGRARRVRIHVDAEGYRARREETLRRLAQKTAARAVRYRRSVALEPMNAYERHVIHAALQDYPNVSTHSSGVDPNRRVIVSYEV